MRPQRRRRHRGTMITFDDVSKTFGRQRAVDSLSFTAPAGRITGFLGPNGAGKSTSLRILCSLCRPDAGRATIDGRRFRDLPVPGREVGVMLDASAHHPGRTGAEVLRLAALANQLAATRVAEALERVGLAGAGGKRVGNYSLGMRQRLGLAVALIGDPAVLVLDEPANGLDPDGIRWMRGLMDDFAAGGGTVLLSSHILAEVQQIADRIVVIDGGRKLVEGDTADLLAGDADRSIVEALDHTRLVAALRLTGIEAQPIGGGRLQVAASTGRVGEIALAAEVVLTRLEPARQDLEQVFFSLTRTDEGNES